jgi:hypothetical protein
MAAVATTNEHENDFSAQRECLAPPQTPKKISKK